MGRIGRKVLVFLSASLVLSSPVMAQTDYLGKDLRIFEGPKDYGTISLVCPNRSNNRVTRISGRRDGILGRTFVEYKDEVATIIHDDLSYPGEQFREVLHYDIRDLPDPALLETVLNIMEPLNTLLNEVCNGSPEAKQRYRELLDSNLSILGLSPGDYPSDF